MDATRYLLVGTAFATALLHTLIPDHWLPFVLIGRARGWSARSTALASGASALLHTALSVGLGLAALYVGRRAAAVVGERLEWLSGILLIVFGLSYAAWAWRKGGHFHPGGQAFHARHEPPPCDGSAGEDHARHLHYHADDGLIRDLRGRGGASLALIVGLNPCVLVLPILLASAREGAVAVASVVVTYGVTTIALMVGLSVAGVLVARRFDPPWAARHMEAWSGLLIAASGVAFWLLE